MNPGERSCNPGERSCNGEVRNLSLNSAELFSSFHKLISFSLNENLVIVPCKVFPPTAPAALLTRHQFFPVTILDAVQGGSAAVLPPDRIMWTVREKCQEISTPLGSLTLSIPGTHSFSPVFVFPGERLNYTSQLCTGLWTEQKISKCNIILKNTITFKNREYWGKKKMYLAQSAEFHGPMGKSLGTYLPSSWCPEQWLLCQADPRKTRIKTQAGSLEMRVSQHSSWL